MTTATRSVLHRGPARSNAAMTSRVTLVSADEDRGAHRSFNGGGRHPHPAADIALLWNRHQGIKGGSDLRGRGFL
jgi:hypothetical protein